MSVAPTFLRARARILCLVLGVVVLGWVAPCAVAAPSVPYAYVANYSSGTVSVIDTATDAVVATVGVGTNPVAVAVSPETYDATVHTSIVTPIFTAGAKRSASGVVCG